MASHGAVFRGARTSCRTILGGRHRQPRVVFKCWGKVDVPCEHARQVPVVLTDGSGGASDSVHQQTLGPQCCHRQVRTVQTFMVQVQFLDTVIDVPIVVQVPEWSRQRFHLVGVPQSQFYAIFRAPSLWTFSAHFSALERSQL